MRIVRGAGRMREANGPMSSWFRKDLGDAMMAFDPLDRITDLFQAAYGIEAHGKDAAVFVRHNSEGNLHCQVEVYFSPAAASLAKKMDADPCDRPSVTGLGLLVGPQDSWSTLFPEGRT